MKKLIFLFTMVLAVSMAMAQTNVDLDQTGSVAYWGTGLINNASVHQTGANIDADFDQISGTWNKVASTQDGTNLFLTLNANAGTSSDADFKQSGLNSDINITQVATSGNNYAQTWQQSGLGYIADNNDIDVVQNAETSNHLKQRQSGKNHVVNLEQNAGTYNKAETYQGQWGALETDNILVGAALGTWGPLYDNLGPASQTSASNYNELYLDQNGSFNKVGLSQDGFDYNYANIYQDGGDNSLLIYQTNATGYNSVISNQLGGHNSATVFQNSYTPGSATITVDQN